jgi:DNA-binding winged helix-turn-helix (wHTH) protein
MNKNIIFGSLTILIVAITFFAFSNKDMPSELKSEKINLALRHTAHVLLRQAGDDTSRIAPIEQAQTNIYMVRLEHNFNYDSLPFLLNQSLMSHGITNKYTVSVWDCDKKNLTLGYTSTDIDKTVPCVGRDMTEGCYNFSVSFIDIPPNTPFSSLLNTILIGISLLISGFLYYFFNKNKEKTPFVEPNTLYDTHQIKIGNSIFDTQKQTFSTNDIQQNLTYREAKLLQLFCNHKNELLDRDFILKEVWEDEGIMVGRSLDVFVSRLRKLLKADDILKITSVHGRGYRLEVQA